MNATMTAQFVADALLMAVWHRGASRMHCCTISMASCSMTVPASSGTMLRIDDFFPLKTERTERKTYRTRDEARPMCRSHREVLQHDRRHSTIG